MSRPDIVLPPPQRGTLRAGPFDLAYSVEGAGRPALVIGSSVYYPRTFSPALRRSLRLAFVDHRGFGTPVAGFTAADGHLSDILDDIEHLRRHLSLGQVVVIGHSGHAYMALEYAKKYPEHVTHVVLIAAGPSHSPAHTAAADRHFEEAVCPGRKARLEADLRALPADLAASPDRRFITFCLRLGARSWYEPTFDAAPLWEGVRVNMPVIDHLWGEAFRDIDITRGLPDLGVPVLLALGRFDYLVAPPFTWDPYRPSFRDLTVRVFDRSAHTPQLEEPALFDRELLDWLARPSPDAGR